MPLCHNIATSEPSSSFCPPSSSSPGFGFRVTWHPLLLCLVSQISVASIVHLSEGYAQIIGPFNPVPLMQIPTTSIHIPLLIEYNKRHSRFQVPNAKLQNQETFLERGVPRGVAGDAVPSAGGAGVVPRISPSSLPYTRNKIYM